MKQALAAMLVAATLLGGCSERSAATGKLEGRTTAVGIMALQWPKVVTANTDFVVKAAVRNASGATIPALGADNAGTLRVNATYHWKAADHRVIVWDGVLTPLAADIPAGAEQKLDVKVRSPAVAGTYILELDLVQTGAFWFGGVGSQTASMLVEVR